MAMTKKDKEAQIYLSYRLREEHFDTYAKLFDLFEFWYFDWHDYIKTNPRLAQKLMWSVAWMEPGKGRLCVNANLEEPMQLLAIRHEILHEYLDHELRLLEYLAEKYPDIAKAEKEQDVPDITLRDILYRDELFNIAGDYEISNRGYTEEDKDLTRHVKLNGQIVSGLVTEDKHPDWINLPIEDMYELLTDEREKMQDQMSNDAQPESPEGQPGEQGPGGGGQSGPSGSGSDDGESSGEAGNGGSGSGGDPITIIRGNYKYGRFYDENGNDITPEA